MADKMDTTQAHVEHMTALALTRHIADRQRQMDTIGTLECLECGEEIPARRRAALPNATRCIDCQSIVEHRGRYGRKG